MLFLQLLLIVECLHELLKSGGSGIQKNLSNYPPDLGVP